MKINLPNAIVDSVKTMRDKSLKITLVTRELPPEEMAGIFLVLQSEADIEIDAVEEDTKSPSQRLRNCLWQLWDKNFREKYPQFEVYYRARMEALCEQIKSKLD